MSTCGFTGYFSSPREKVGKGMHMEQENALANVEPTENTQALKSWRAKYLSPWTWARLEVQIQAREGSGGSIPVQLGLCGIVRPTKHTGVFVEGWV